MKHLVTLLVYLLLAPSAYAQTHAADAFIAINNCVKKSDTSGCTDYFTASSHELYTRFMSYGLMECLPKDARYFSEEEKNGGILLRAKVTDYGKERYMRLLFVEEEARWKLDIPGSLQISMGKNWEKQVQMTEQVFLLMKAQLGDKLDCDLIRGLVAPKKK